MRRLVVDASVAAKWFWDEAYSHDARAVFETDNYLYAPDFFLLELDNIFCKRLRRHELSREDAEDARSILRELPIEFHPIAMIQEHAFAIAIRTNRSLYDCLYLALARILEGKMLTADRKFYEALSGGPFSGDLLWVTDIS